MAITPQTGLLHFLSYITEPVKVLVIESALYLPQLRQLMPNAEFHAVVADDEIAELPDYQNLGVIWSHVNYLEEPLPYEHLYFDYIICEHCLELAVNAQDLASGLSFYMKPTGYFLSSFANVRHWKVIKQLMNSEFRFLARRPFAKGDYMRLLAASFYKDAVFAPQKKYAPEGFVQLLMDAGFENYSDDLEVETWMVRAAKSTPEILALKQMYTQEDRRILSTLLHRLEYGISIKENTEALVDLLDSKHIFPAYVADFIQQAVLLQDDLFANLIPALDAMDRISLADDLVDEMEQRLMYDSKITTLAQWKNRIVGEYAVQEHTGRRIKDVLQENREYPPEKMFAFITCVNSDYWYDEAKIYLNELLVPEGYGVELIDVRNAKSMCEGYNRGMRQAKAKYKIYFHQDCFLVNENMLNYMLHIFNSSSDIGAIGSIGARNLPKSGVWWDGLRVYGRVIHACEPESVIDSEVEQPDEEFIDVAGADGLMLATQVDVEWREDLFTGWHFYDVSLSRELARRGYRTVVPRQERCWCIHCPTEKPLDKAYKVYQKVFIKEYGSEWESEV